MIENQVFVWQPGDGRKKSEVDRSCPMHCVLRRETILDFDLL